LLDQLKVKADKIAEKAKEKKEELKEEDSTQNLWNDIRQIIERFTGEKNLDDLLDALNDFYVQVKNDPKLNQFLIEAKSFILRAIDDPKTLDAEVTKQEVNRLMSLARSFSNDKRYEVYSRRIFDEAKEIGNAITEDPLSKQLSDTFSKFISDLALDKKGNFSLGALQDSLITFKSLLVPVIMKQMENIPVARIEGSSKKYDYILDNLKFSAYDVLPEHIKFYMDTKVDLNLKEGETDTAKAHLILDITNIKTHIKNLAFAYRRKAIPKVEDEGVADIDLAGDGTSIRLQWKIQGGDKVPIKFVMQDCQCHIDELKITIKEAKHSFLDKIATKLFTGTAKRSLEDEVESNLRFIGLKISDQFNDSVWKIYSSY